MKIRLMAEITDDSGKKVVAPIEIEREIPSVKEFGEAMYAKGMSQRDIEDTIQEIYGAESSQGMISRITDKLPAGDIRWKDRGGNDTPPPPSYYPAAALGRSSAAPCLTPILPIFS